MPGDAKSESGPAVPPTAAGLIDRFAGVEDTDGFVPTIAVAPIVAGLATLAGAAEQRAETIARMHAEILFLRRLLETRGEG